MATRTITIKDTYVPEMIEVFGEGYMEMVPDPSAPNDPDAPLVTNPQTKAQFAGQQFDEELKGYIKRRVQAYRMNQAQQTIDETSITE